MVKLMNIDDYTKISHKRYSNINDYNDKKIKYFKTLITRILLSVLMIIIIATYIKIDDDNASLVNKYLFQDNIKFTKINKWYQDNFGAVIPSIKENSSLVFSENIEENSYTSYKDGVKIQYTKGKEVSLLNGGIVIFTGEEENYGNVVVIQGNDGIDYTYGNISNIAVNLYDYIEKNTIIGNANDDYIYLILNKDGKIINYDEYLKENKN